MSMKHNTVPRRKVDGVRIYGKWHPVVTWSELVAVVAKKIFLKYPDKRRLIAGIINAREDKHEPANSRYISEIGWISKSLSASDASNKAHELIFYCDDDILEELLRDERNTTIRPKIEEHDVSGDAFNYR